MLAIPAEAFVWTPNHEQARSYERAAFSNKATSGRAILAIDGCPLHRARACLAQHGVTANVHITLSRYGLRKR